MVGNTILRFPTRGGAMNFAGCQPVQLQDLRTTPVGYLTSVESMVKESLGSLMGLLRKWRLNRQPPSSLEIYEGESLAIIVCLSKGSILQFAYKEKSEGGKRIIISSSVALGEKRRGLLLIPRGSCKGAWRLEERT